MRKQLLQELMIISEEEKKFQKSLDGTGVTRDEYNKILKKLETLNEHF